MNAPETIPDRAISPTIEELSFFQILRFYYRRRFLLLSIFLAVFLSLATFLSTRGELYGARAVISSAAPEGSSGGLGLASGISGLLGMGGAAPTTPEFLEYINSFETMHLARRMAADPAIMHGAFADQWDEKNRKWHPPRSLRYRIFLPIRKLLSNYNWTPPTAHDLQSYISSNLVIAPLDESSFYEVSYNHHDRQFSEYFLSSALIAMDTILKERRQEDLAKRENYLKKRLSIENNSVIIDAIMQQASSVLSNLVFLEGREFYAITLIDPPFTYQKPILPKASYTIVVSFLVAFAAALTAVFTLGLIRFIRGSVKTVR